MVHVLTTRGRTKSKSKMSAKYFMTMYTLQEIGSDELFSLGSLMQQMRSKRLFSWRLESRDRSATNAVT